MSWSFSYSAADKAEAHKMLEEKVASQGGHCPESIGDIVANAIDALPECEDSIINVSTNGHFNTGEHRGTSSMTVSVSNQFKPTQ